MASRVPQRKSDGVAGLPNFLRDAFWAVIGTLGVAVALAVMVGLVIAAYFLYFVLSGQAGY